MTNTVSIEYDPCKFFLVPEQIFTDKRLSVTASTFFIHAHRCAMHGTKLTKKNLMERIDWLTERKYRKAVKELEAAGYITFGEQSNHGGFGEREIFMTLAEPEKPSITVKEFVALKGAGERNDTRNEQPKRKRRSPLPKVKPSPSDDARIACARGSSQHVETVSNTEPSGSKQCPSKEGSRDSLYLFGSAGSAAPRNETDMSKYRKAKSEASIGKRHAMSNVTEEKAVETFDRVMTRCTSTEYRQDQMDRCRPIIDRMYAPPAGIDSQSWSEAVDGAMGYELAFGSSKRYPSYWLADYIDGIIGAAMETCRKAVEKVEAVIAPEPAFEWKTFIP